MKNGMHKIKNKLNKMKWWSKVHCNERQIKIIETTNTIYRMKIKISWIPLQCVIIWWETVPDSILSDCYWMSVTYWNFASSNNNYIWFNIMQWEDMKIIVKSYYMERNQIHDLLKRGSRNDNDDNDKIPQHLNLTEFMRGLKIYRHLFIADWF